MADKTKQNAMLSLHIKPNVVQNGCTFKKIGSFFKHTYEYQEIKIPFAGFLEKKLPHS